MQGLIDRIKPRFQSNLHSFGEWLLYPQGWQVGTLDADNPVYVALGGTDANPAIPGFNPGQAADTLYVTNGETTDYADTTRRHGRVHARARRGRAGRRLRVPRRRGAGPGRVREDAAVPPRARALGARIPPTRSRRSASTPSRSTSTRTTSTRRTGSSRCSTSASASPTAIRRRCGCWRGAASAPSGSSTGSTAARCTTRRRPSGPEASATEPATGAHYHVDARHGDRDRARRPGEGVVRGRSASASDSFTYTVASDTGRRVLVRGGRGLHGRLAGQARRDRTAVPVVLRRRAHRERRRLRRLRRRRPRPHCAGQPRRAQPLRRGALVHGRRRRDARAGLGPGQRVAAGDAGAARGRATSSTKAVGCSTPASAPGSSTRRPSARSSTTRSRTSSAACRPGGRGPLPAAVGIGRLAG